MCFLRQFLNTRSHYDVAIIGAGMSGLAAGIRLAHFGRRVCIFERHNAVGGLNGFYSIDGRKFDVGLHAVTNFTPAGVKNTALTRILRQLRIERDEFALCPQKQCRITFGALRGGGSVSLRATNDFAFFESEVARVFPSQIDGFRRLAAMLCGHNDDNFSGVSAREVVRRYVSDPLLEDMIFCPVMYYGSAQEHDMDFDQFALLFRAIFFEGLARPLEGVRVILRVLLEKYRAAGGERRMKCGVRQILSTAGSASGLLLDDGSEVTATHILSGIGGAETEALMEGGLRLEWHGLPARDFAACESGRMSKSPKPTGWQPVPLQAHGLAARATSSPRAGSLCHDGRKRRFEPIRNPQSAIPVGRISYVETVSVLNCQPAALGWGDDSIVFFNEGSRFVYARPENEQVNAGGGAICIPNNFEYPDGENLSEGFVRCTCLANYERWKGLSEERYLADKRRWFAAMTESAKRFMPTLASADALERATVASDVFTPLTIERFTGHVAGAIYGSPVKNRFGRTALDNVYLCGTDQGFLGITGAMLSGISMANFHILQKHA